jgi:WD40 repeat protein
MPAPSPPSPKHILRSHRDQITSLHLSDDNERLYSGDITGLVVLTATRTLRTLVLWKAHTNGILAVKEWEGVDRYIIS